ncbi:hypothetical protein XJ44_05320 [Thermosipho affectus]|uniref:Uncharacterized protein n=1 Tax=Thermosipho affectus TaxID=660294 RepID=A0ABX3IIF9_9BACT|nr:MULTISPECIES: hypothetical protein [Thermosipho]ONN27205.1 hypothetical protein XJ44_05320 [Thermosipho affectus]OOC43544.1 hypothetical protein XO08_05225 [Thermosipho sp. 1074]
MKKFVLLFLVFSIAIFSGEFLIFDNSIILNSPPFFMQLGDSFGVGFSYSTETRYYTVKDVGFLKVKIPQSKEAFSGAFFVGSNFGIYLYVENEVLQIPNSFQNLEFFVSKDYAFYSSLSKSFYAIGPISLNTRSLFLKKGFDFGYSMNRYFFKYKDYSGYFLNLAGKYFLGYLYPLDNSLEQGILGGLGSNFKEIYLDVGIRKFFDLGKIRGFGYAYVYSPTNDIFNFNYFTGFYVIQPLKGEFVVWDGKISIRFNW